MAWSGPAPVDHEAGLKSQLSNELTLSAAISLPESVYGIDLTQVETGSLREPRRIGPL